MAVLLLVKVVPTTAISEGVIYVNKFVLTTATISRVQHQKLQLFLLLLCQGCVIYNQSRTYCYYIRSDIGNQSRTYCYYIMAVLLLVNVVPTTAISEGVILVNKFVLTTATISRVWHLQLKLFLLLLYQGCIIGSYSCTYCFYVRGVSFIFKVVLTTTISGVIFVIKVVLTAISGV